MPHGVLRYGPKLGLLDELVAGRHVLHLGAVGETMESLERKVAAAPRSVHAALTRSAKKVVGVDYDAAAVEAITAAGHFTNLVACDVYELDREDIDLEAIDVIVAGDIVEHLSNPGLFLTRLAELADDHTRLAVTVPNAVGLPQFLRYLRGRPIEGLDHKCSFNSYTLAHLLAESRWDVDHVSTCYQPMAAAINGGVAFRLGLRFFQLFPHLGGTLLAVAHRHRPAGVDSSSGI